MKSLILYYIVFFVSTKLLYKGLIRKETINFQLLLGLLILTVFAGGRYFVGTDYRNYLSMFNKIYNSSWGDIFKQKEIIFKIIVKATYSLGGRVLTWSVLALIMSSIICYVLKTKYNNIFFEISLFVYISVYYTSSFNIARQILATCIIFLSINYIFENNFFGFILCVMIAIGIHNSAAICLLMWFFWDHQKNKTYKNIKLLLILILSIPMILYYDKIIYFFTSKFSLVSKYEYYLSNFSKGENRDIYIYIFELFIFTVLLNKINIYDNRAFFFYILMIFSVIIGVTGFRNTFIKRSALYFLLPSRMYLFGTLPNVFTERSRPYVKVFIIIYFSLLFFVSSYVLGHSDIIPYVFDIKS